MCSNLCNLLLTALRRATRGGGHKDCIPLHHLPRSYRCISFQRKGVVPLAITTLNVSSSPSSTQIDTIAVLPGFYSEVEAAKHLIHLNVVNGPTTLAEIHSIWEQT